MFDDLSSKLARFADDYGEQVRQARPHLPNSLNDRAQDNWEPLLAIAMVAGSEWLDLATETALKLSGTEISAKSIAVELLSDIQEVFGERFVDKISSKELIKALCDDEERPWASYNRGKPITQRQLAAKLKDFKIVGKSVRITSLSTPKGYEKKQFDEAFSRYIPLPPLSATTPQVNSSAGLGIGLSATVPQRCGLSATNTPSVVDKIPLFIDMKENSEVF